MWLLVTLLLLMTVMARGAGFPSPIQWRTRAVPLRTQTQNPTPGGAEEGPNVWSSRQSWPRREGTLICIFGNLWAVFICWEVWVPSPGMLEATVAKEHKLEDGL